MIFLILYKFELEHCMLAFMCKEKKYGMVCICVLAEVLSPQNNSWARK
jgi:hypothetical protein